MSDNNEPLLTWSELVTTPLNQREASSFLGVDLAFGNALVNIFRGAQCNHPSSAYDSTRAFLARAPVDQIKRSPYSDPKQFLRALRAKETKDLVKAPGILPLVYFQRTPGHVVAEGDRYAPVRDYATLYAADTPNSPGATVHQHHVSLTYRVYVLAWELEALDMISATLSAWFRRHGRKIAYCTQLMGAEIDGYADIMTNVLAWDDLSPGIDTDRLQCLGCSIELTAEAYEAQSLDVREVRYALLEPTPLFGNGDAL